jgi:rhodanese-related sulfurtransferase
VAPVLARAVRQGRLFDPIGGAAAASIVVNCAASLVAQARAGIENLTPAQVAAEPRRPWVVLVDPRERDQPARDGPIVGAILVPRSLLDFVADPSQPCHSPKLGPDARLILHCACGGRSGLAASTLTGMGYSPLAHLDGGCTAWKAKGLPIRMV